MYGSLAKYSKLLADACDALQTETEYQHNLLNVVTNYNEMIGGVIKRLHDSKVNVISRPPGEIEDVDEIEEIELETPASKEKPKTAQQQLDEMELEEEKQEQKIQEKKLSRREAAEVWRKNSEIGNECLKTIQQIKDNKHSIKLKIESVETIVDHINTVMYKDQSSLYTVEGGVGLQKALEFLQDLTKET